MPLQHLLPGACSDRDPSKRRGPRQGRSLRRGPTRQAGTPYLNRVRYRGVGNGPPVASFTGRVAVRIRPRARPVVLALCRATQSDKKSRNTVLRRLLPLAAGACDSDAQRVHRFPGDYRNAGAARIWTENVEPGETRIKTRNRTSGK
jgi:hypothetical protein